MEPIKIWPYCSAPPELRAICPCHGGDEDYLALLPKGNQCWAVESWVDSDWRSVCRHDLDTGEVIFVGAHS